VEAKQWLAVSLCVCVCCCVAVCVCVVVKSLKSCGGNDRQTMTAFGAALLPVLLPGMRGCKSNATLFKCVY
jgi:hypothetical protein